MEVKHNKTGGTSTLYLYGELDECSAVYTKNLIDKVIEDNLNSKEFVFDLSGVTFMDSTGVGLLIGRYKKLTQFRIPSYISGANFSTEKVIQLSGLYTIMPKF